MKFGKRKQKAVVFYEKRYIVGALADPVADMLIYYIYDTNGESIIEAMTEEQARRIHAQLDHFLNDPYMKDQGGKQ